MPGIDLAALSGADLRRLLKVAHTRHDGLLSDRLEWEIADRAAHGNRAPTHFAQLSEPPDDDEEEPAFGCLTSEAEPVPPRAAALQTAQTKPRGVWLVTLGAVAGSVLSAMVFWGLERIDARAPSQPMTPAAPAEAPVTLAAAAVEPAPSTPIAAPPAAAPVKRQQRAQVARARASGAMTVASAERGSRPPNLSEWLDGKAEEPIY